MHKWGRAVYFGQREGARDAYLQDICGYRPTGEVGDTDVEDDSEDGGNEEEEIEEDGEDARAPCYSKVSSLLCLVIETNDG
jgi:hypothetical protein